MGAVQFDMFGPPKKIRQLVRVTHNSNGSHWFGLMKVEGLFEELDPGNKPVRGLPVRTFCGYTCWFIDGSCWQRKWGEWTRIWSAV